MARETKIIGDCPKCGNSELACSHNHFEKDDLVIDSWEHKCPDCSLRETTAYRSDDEDYEELEADPRRCPYCGRLGEAAIS